jgi:predicted nucleic-acid-binding protein
MDLIFELDVFRVERESLVRHCLELYRNGRGDFADYLIGAIGAEAGCRDTVTFDRALRGAANFSVL